MTHTATSSAASGPDVTATSTVIIVGCGNIGTAVASRLGAAGYRPVLVSRSATSITRAQRHVPSSLVAASFVDALTLAPSAPVLVTVDCAASARAMLAACLNAPGAPMAHRDVVIALFDEPRHIGALVSELAARSAAVQTLGFLGTPDMIRDGRAPFVSDAIAESPTGRLLARLGPHIAVPPGDLASALALAAPLLYGALTALHAWAVGWVTRNGLPASAWLDGGQTDPFIMAPVETFQALRDGARVGDVLTVDALRQEWLRVIEASAALGVDDRIPRQLTSLLSALSSGPSLDACFGNAPRESGAHDRSLGDVLSAGLVASPVGVPARLVGLGFQLVLFAVEQQLRVHGPHATAALLQVVRTLDVVRDPLPSVRDAERFRWTPAMYTAPLVQAGLLATELAKATAAATPGTAAATWLDLLATLYGETAARNGHDADLTAVYEIVVPPRRSARKAAALENSRDYLSPGRVAFFERAGVPFVMGRREGAYLADIDDTRAVLNLHCNGGVFNFGHRPEALSGILARASAQVDIGNHHLLSDARSQLARRVAHTMPAPLRRVAFAASATEITDFAIRLARAATGRRRVLSSVGSFHGTAGLGAHAGDERFVAWAGARAPEFMALPRWDLAAMEREIARGDVALVLLETVQASSGMHLPPDGYYRALSAICRAYGCLLALDEVQCGWGRSGRLWAFEHFDVVPDIVILGKGMSGGIYPMAGCCYDPRLGATLEQDPFVHQSTSGGSELGCAVTNHVLDLVLDPGFLPRVHVLAARFAAGLGTLVRESPIVTTIHQLGLFISVGMVSPLLGPLVTKACFDRGLLVLFSGLSPDFVQVLPPLTLENDEVDWALARFAEALDDAATIAGRSTGARTTPTPRHVESGPATGNAIQRADAPAATTSASGLCGTMHPRLPDVLQWSPGETSDVARVVRTIPGLNADVSVVEITVGGRRDRYVMKPLPGFKPDHRYDEYDALITEYIARLRRAGIRCLDTWMVSRGGRKTAWVVQPALPPEWLLTARLPQLSRGERQALFRRIIALAQAALRDGCGLDAHFANWALPSVHELDPVLLDVTQPLLRDDAGRIRMTYGAAGVPLVVERYLSGLLSADLFTLEPLVLDMVANMRLDDTLARYEAAFLLAVREQSGLEPSPAALDRATRKVRRMRGTLHTLRTLAGDARAKPHAAPV